MLRGEMGRLRGLRDGAKTPADRQGFVKRINELAAEAVKKWGE